MCAWLFEEKSDYSTYFSFTPKMWCLILLGWIRWNIWSRRHYNKRNYAHHGRITSYCPPHGLVRWNQSLISIPSIMYSKHCAANTCTDHIQAHTVPTTYPTHTSTHQTLAKHILTTYKHIPTTYQTHTNTYQTLAKHILTTYKHIPTTYQTHTITHQTLAKHILTSYKHILTTSQPHNDHILTALPTTFWADQRAHYYGALPSCHTSESSCQVGPGQASSQNNVQPERTKTTNHTVHSTLQQHCQFRTA